MKDPAKVLVFLLTVTCLLGFANPAAAIPITYVMSGTASGSIGGTPFSSALVTVSLASDTSTVQGIPGFPPAVANVGATSINITGIGTAIVTDPTAIFSSVIPVLIDTGFPVLPYVVIGTLDNPPNVDEFTGIGVLGSNLLAGYSLTTSIGPITSSPGGVGYPPGLIIHTSIGNLTFTGNPSPTTSGTFTAVTSPVPEPSSLLTLCASVLVLCCARLRTRSRG